MISPTRARREASGPARWPLPLWLALIAFLQAGPSAHAEEAATTDVTAARERFQQGVERYNDGDFERALVDFQESFELNPLPQVLFNIGVTQYELHRQAEALETLHRYVEQGAEEPRDRLEAARGLLTELEGLFGRLSVTSSPEGAELALDGVQQGPTPIERWLSPGAHQLELRQEGFEPLSQAVEVRAGQPLELALELTRLRRPWYRRWWVWTIAGAVIAGTATGLAVGLTRESGARIDVSVERGDGP